MSFSTLLARSLNVLLAFKSFNSTVSWAPICLGCVFDSCNLSFNSLFFNSNWLNFSSLSMHSFSFSKALNVTPSLCLGVVAEPMALSPTGDVGHLIVNHHLNRSHCIWQAFPHYAQVSYSTFLHCHSQLVSKFSEILEIRIAWKRQFLRQNIIIIIIIKILTYRMRGSWVYLPYLFTNCVTRSYDLLDSYIRFSRLLLSRKNTVV